MTEFTTAGPASCAIGVSAETNAMIAVVPPAKKTGLNIEAIFFKDTGVFGQPRRQSIAADSAVADADLRQLCQRPLAAPVIAPSIG